ncbi:MAG: ABC transporter ATP-binding protein [Patescibacteria group bacterium]
MGNEEVSEKKNAFTYLFGRMWKFSEGNRKKVVLYLVLSVMSELVNTFWSPLVMAAIMNILVTEGANLEKIIPIMLLLPLGSFLSWSFHGPSRYLEEVNAFLARANYRKYQLQGVMDMPLKWHNEHHTGDTVDKLEKGASSIYEFSSESFQFVKPLVKLIGCFAAVTYFSNVSAFIVVAIMIIGILVTVKIDNFCGSIIRYISKQENILSESVHDTINNISTIITLRVEHLAFKSIVQKIMIPFDQFKKMIMLNEGKWFVTSMCCSFMTIAVYYVYFLQHPGGKEAVNIGSFYLVVNYLNKVSELFNQFTGLYGWTIRRKYRLQNGEKLSRDFISRSFADHHLPGNWEKIQVSNLWFTHGSSDDDNPHLDDVSFDIYRGETIATVGPSGSGKSTLLMVTRDMYHPQTVEVLVDGMRAPLGFKSISKAISFVQQEPQILEQSIKDNITFGEEYSDELIRLYSDVACFSEVVDSLPKGYDSMIKEKGVNLSGGQVQRLALTRGLLASHDKDIVLLDEPTSSLDSVTAMKVFKNIIEQFKGKTVISSVHTLQMLPLFDRVFMFDKGKLVGAGTIPELLKTCPEFVKLWEEQFAECA